MRLTILLTILLLSSLSIAQPAEHWKKIGTFDLGYHNPDPLGNTQGEYGTRISCCFFFDEFRGLVAQSTFSIAPFLAPRIYFTPDGGKNWVRASIPIAGDTAYFRINIGAIWMQDTLIGWAAVQDAGQAGKRVLWATTDGGLSWDEALDQGIAVPNGADAIDNVRCSNGRPITCSWGLDFFDDLSGCAVAYAAPPTDALACFTTSNGGASWSTAHAPSTMPQPYGIHADPLTRIAYAYPVSQRGVGGTYHLFESSDGLTWVERESRPRVRTSGDIDGAGSAIYINGYKDGEDSLAGFWRSLDQGRTFDFVGGPRTGKFTRFHVPPSCNGGIVVGFDSMSVWLTTAGGDGILAAVHPLLIRPVSFPVTSACSTSAAYLTLENAQCRTFTFTHAELVQTNDAFHFDSVGTFPLKLDNNSIGKIEIVFDPDLRVGAHTARIRLVGYEELPSGRREIDTIVEVSANAEATPPQLTPSDPGITFPLISTCQTKDTLITVKNQGCDTLTLNSISTLGPQFLFSGATTPLSLAPDSSHSISVKYAPNGPGIHYGSVKYVAEQHGIPRTIEVVLDGEATEGSGALSFVGSTHMELPNISFCNTHDTFVTVRNTGCDTLLMISASITGQGEFGLVSPPQNVVIPPNGSLSIRVGFIPQQKGLRSATLQVAWSDKHGQVLPEIVLTYEVKVSSGSRIANTSVAALNFGILNLCTDSTQNVTLHNDGCDTLTITEADITGSFEHDGDFPIVLKPQETRTITVTTLLDTVGGNMTSTGVLRFTSNADNTLPAITLSRGYKYPRTIDLTLTVNGSGSAHESEDVRMSIAPISDMTDVERVSFDLVYDSDLLSNISLSTGALGAVSRDADGLTRQRIAIDAPLGATLTELEFSTRLAVRAVTPIRIENIRLNESDPDFENCVARVQSATGGEFSYLYNCGDRELQNFLRDGSMPFSIVSLHPNPVSDVLTVDLDDVADVSVTVIDALGKRVMTSRSRTNRIELDTRGLSDGLYFLEITAQGSQQVRSFVKR